MHALFKRISPNFNVNTCRMPLEYMHMMCQKYYVNLSLSLSISLFISISRLIFSGVCFLIFPYNYIFFLIK